MHRISRRATLLALATALASPAFAAKPEPAKLTKVTFVTDWKAQAEHGGFYQAVANGLYKKAGLDVTIKQGGPAVNMPQLIAAGAVDFAMGSNHFQPLNIVAAGGDAMAVAAIFQKDPQVLITHPRDDIKTHRRHEGQAHHDLRRHDLDVVDLGEGALRLRRQADPQIHLQPRAVPGRQERDPARLRHVRALHDRDRRARSSRRSSCSPTTAIPATRT